MYKVDSNIAYINGSSGLYDEKIRNASVCYDRNAVSNFAGYINDFRYNPVELPDMKQLKSLSQDKFEAKMKQLDDAMEQI